MKKRYFILLSCTLIMTAMLMGCINDSESKEETQQKKDVEILEKVEENVEKDEAKKDEAKKDEAKKDSYNVSIKSLDTEFKYENEPKRVVVLDYISCQILVALGLEDRIVALAPSMNTIEDVKSEYKDTISSIKMFDEDKMTRGVPSLEVVLTEEPDFVIGTAYAFNQKNVGAIEDFVENNINIYATEGTYVEKPTIKNIYNDIRNIGEIFNVPDKANKLIADMQEREKKIMENFKSSSEVTIYNFDTNMNDGTMYTVAGSNLLDDLIHKIGGKNIFGNLGKGYARVSLEEVISLNPQYIIVTNYYTATDAQKKIDFIKSTPELSDVNAVKEENYIIIPGICLRPGLQTLDALEIIANAIEDKK